MHSSLSESNYLDEVLSEKQIRKLQRKQKRQLRQKNQPGKVVDISQMRRTKHHIEAQTTKQQKLITAIRKNDQVITYGCAGTGKTFVTAAMASILFDKGEYEKIIITRPNVATGRSIGFFPGTIEDKLAPWVAPVTGVIKKFLGDSVYEIAQKRGDIQLIPFEVIRGYSFENSFIILDEAQNCTYEEIKAFLTRVGEDSKVVINGDISQTDLGVDSGFDHIINMAKRSPYLRGKVPIVDFTADDIVRSDICADWVKTFEMDY